MKHFTKITDQVDRLPRWYWRFADKVRRERTWHGPFPTDGAARDDAARYDV